MVKAGGERTVDESQARQGTWETGHETVGFGAERHENKVALLCEAVVETRVVIVFAADVRMWEQGGGRGTLLGIQKP